MSLVATRLTLRAGPRTLIDTLDLALDPGEILGILGPNGAGKSTLLAVLAGLAAPAGGEVRLDGQPVSALPPLSRAQHIGLLPQGDDAAFLGSVADFVALGHYPFGGAPLDLGPHLAQWELAALARAHPGKLTYGTTGIGSDDHLAMLMFERIAGVKLNHVPFRGAAEVRSAIAARQIDVASINIGEALQAQKGGLALRNLGQMSPARTTLAPDLPTFREQGYMIELSSLRGMAAPRGLPADIRERLVKAVAAAIADPEFQSQAVRLFAPIRFLPPAQFEAAMREADTGFRELWKIMPWADK